ncbi:hypothetical protein OROGR_013471 [Orobanche gracilis]
MASLLEEYFNVRLLDEALLCIEDLKAPAYNPEAVKEAISIGLEKSPPCVELSLEDLAIELPKAPAQFGEIVGGLVLAGGLDFKVVSEILVKVGDTYYQKAVFDAAMKTVRSGHAGKEVVYTQASDIAACECLF